MVDDVATDAADADDTLDVTEDAIDVAKDTTDATFSNTIDKLASGIAGGKALVAGVYTVAKPGGGEGSP